MTGENYVWSWMQCIRKLGYPLESFVWSMDICTATTGLLFASLIVTPSVTTSRIAHLLRADLATSLRRRSHCRQTDPRLVVSLSRSDTKRQSIAFEALHAVVPPIWHDAEPGPLSTDRRTSTILGPVKASRVSVGKLTCGQREGFWGCLLEQFTDSGVHIRAERHDWEGVLFCHVPSLVSQAAISACFHRVRRTTEVGFGASIRDFALPLWRCRDVEAAVRVSCR